MTKKSRIKFIQEEKSDFFSTLRKRVDGYFKENEISKKANPEMVTKTIILFTAYISPFIIMLLFNLPFWANMVMWSIMGISVAGIGMSVMHDANHGAYSRSTKTNRYLGYSLNLLGGAVFNWKLQHNKLHHTYTNIIDMDEDIEDKLLLKFSPHTKVKFFHKFQVVYAFLFYGILSLYWVLLKDIVQFIKYTVNGVNANSTRENVNTVLRILWLKVVYFFVILYVPIVIFGMPVSTAIYGFLLMHFFAGLILTVVFQLAHTVEGTTHPRPDKSGNIENDWAIHQMNTTVNFARHNRLINWYVGGLNFQVEHHLFPGICHVHYPKIAPIVKQTAEEYGIPYMENRTFLDALKSHVSLLKRMGSGEYSAQKMAVAD